MPDPTPQKHLQSQSVKDDVVDRESVLAVAAVKPTSGSKRKRAAAKPASGLLVEHACVAEAETLGLGSALRNLASRDEIIKSGIPMEELLSALRQAGGLVNKAKAALLAC